MGLTFRGRDHVQGRAGRRGRSGLVSALGLRRIDLVRMEQVDEGVRLTAVGVGHRLPVERRITATTAASLVAAGVPLVRCGSEAV